MSDRELLTPERVARTATVQRLISTVLRVGVLTSMALVVVGTLITFLAHPRYATHDSALHHLEHSPAAFPHSLSGVIDGVAAGRGPAIVLLGLIVLVATPVVRVAISIVIFSIERDRKFVAITAFVLLMLLASFALGRASG